MVRSSLSALSGQSFVQAELCSGRALFGLSFVRAELCPGRDRRDGKLIAASDMISPTYVYDTHASIIEKDTMNL